MLPIYMLPNLHNLQTRKKQLQKKLRLEILFNFFVHVTTTQPQI